MIRALFQAMRHEYLDLTITSGPDFVVCIMERPALWMEAEDLAALRQQLLAVASKTLPAGSLTYGVFEKGGTRLSETIITLVLDPSGAPIAFNALAPMQVDSAPAPVEVLHLGLVMVDPAHRQRNLSWVLYGLTCFLIFLRRQFRPIWVSNVTQVPAVVGMVDTTFAAVWPAPRAGPRKLAHLMLARAIMADHRAVFGVGADATFDEEHFVIKAAYGGGSEALQKTWDDAPKHRADDYNAFCTNMLDYGHGDDLLQLGQMNLAAMRQYLSRSVPQSALLALLGAGGLVALRLVVLPVVYWADARKAWRDLRPLQGGRQ